MNLTSGDPKVILQQDDHMNCRQFYDVVIRQRSDAYWLAPLVIKSLPHDAVSVKKCAHYGGVNDKIAVIPRQFAKHWMELLLDYYISEHRLHQGYPNPESFIGLNAMAKSIKVAPQAAELLPTVDYRPYMQPDGDKATEEGCFSPIYLGSPSVAYSIAEDASGHFFFYGLCFVILMIALHFRLL